MTLVQAQRHFTAAVIDKSRPWALTLKSAAQDRKPEVPSKNFEFYEGTEVDDVLRTAVPALSPEAASGILDTHS